MNKLNFAKLKNVISANSPDILIGFGIAGIIGSVIFAVKATPKAIDAIDKAEIEKAKQESGDISEHKRIVAPLTPVETIKVTWKYYIPTVSTVAFSISCILAAHNVTSKRNAALLAAYKISETAFEDYREKVVETIGEKKDSTIRNKVAQDKVTKDPVENHEVIVTKAGETLCKEPLSGRYFYSDPEKIRQSLNELNALMLSECYVSLNDWYYLLGLDNTDVGDDIGWSTGTVKLIDITFDAVIATDNRPCLVVDYLTPPKYGYRDLY